MICPDKNGQPIEIGSVIQFYWTSAHKIEYGLVIRTSSGYYNEPGIEFLVYTHNQEDCKVVCRRFDWFKKKVRIVHNLLYSLDDPKIRHLFEVIDFAKEHKFLPPDYMIP